MLSPFLLFGATAVLSFALTAIVRSFALRSGLLDKPNARSSHEVPTPRGGGAALLVSAMLVIAAAAAQGLVDLRVSAILGAGTLVVAVVGCIDDRRGVPPLARFLVHLVVALATVHTLGGLPELSLGAMSLRLGAFGYVVAVLGIVWSINLFNFMDGIDGIAASQAAIIFAAASMMLFAMEERSLGFVALVFAGASIGFLGWNWPRARIFMGDVGSGALGYLVAALALASEAAGAAPILAFAMLGALFVFDATATLIRRFWRGQPLAEAHRDHAYQRLVRAGATHRAVTLAYGLASGFAASIGLAAALHPELLLPALALVYVALATVYALIERRAPM